MIVCRVCNTENDDDAVFCVGCGSKDGLAPATPVAAAPIPGEPVRSGDATVPLGPTVIDQPDVLAMLKAVEGKLDALQADVKSQMRGAADSAAAVERLGAEVERAFEDMSRRFDEKIARNEHEATALKQVSAELEEHRNGLYEKLTMPLIRDIVEVRNGIEAAMARHSGPRGAGDVPASEVAVFSDMLADTLAKHSVEVVRSSPGDEFLSFKHKAVGKVVTDDPALQGRVAEVEGDSYRMGDQYIVQALVRVYTLDGPAYSAGAE